MIFDVITLFPETFLAITEYGITARAFENKVYDLQCWNPREFTTDNHKTVDDRPYGGGPGMLMLVEPLEKTIAAVKEKQARQGVTSKVIHLSPSGAGLTHKKVMELSQEEGLVLLTSRYEGFPRVITESLAIGTPVVSVDCQSGPNEIIINEFNGLLVENHNPEVLAKAMNRLYEDKDLYLHCKSNTKASVKELSKAAIGLQWKAILK